MLKSAFYKTLYLGKERQFDSLASEKRAILTGQLSLICIALSLFYFIVDLILGSTDSILVYGLLSIVGVSSFFINRSGHTKIAKNFLMVGANLVVFITFEREFEGTGSYMFFMSCMLGSFALFGFEGKKYAIMLSILSIVLFFVAHKYEFKFIPKTDFTANEADLNFMINFTISSITAIVIITFMLNLNASAESELRRTSEELIRNKQRFELAIKGSSVGIWDWDIKNDSLFLSPLMISLLKYPEEKYVNMTSEKIERVGHPNDLPQIRKALEQHLKDRKPFMVEGRLRKGDNSYFWTLISGQAEWNEHGRPTRMVGTIVEIDDLKKAFKQLEIQNELLEKTNEELDRFVYSTSHDLRAPLSSIQGLVNVAVHSGDTEEIIQCLKMIENRVFALNGFIAEIIDYSRNSRLEVVTDHINLRELVSEVVEGLQFFDKSGDIQFLLEVEEDFEIDTDRGRLKIILNNLIANAVKYHDYTKSKPYVRVTSEFKNDQVVIVIEDNGRGIEEEYQEKIFNMFFRASEISEGSGLGLYITKEMVDKLKGSIRLESEYTKGTTFYIDLPINKSIAKQVTA